MRIEIRDLYKSFGELHVFRGINLDIAPGEICVIMGGSGQGKSVLLKHLVGLERPDKGRILVDGQDIVPFTESELYPIRMRIGMIFQNGGLLHSLDVRENVALPLLEVKGCDLAKTYAKVKEKLDVVGMGTFMDQRASTLSGGQRKRVAIARALVQEADCLLFDEPTAGLDPIMSHTVDEAILEVNRDTGATCIVVTHDLVSAFRLAHRMHLLDKGQFILSGTPADFRASKIDLVQRFLERAFLPAQ